MSSKKPSETVHGEGGREGAREGGREGGRKGGRKRGREEEREGRMEDGRKEEREGPGRGERGVGEGGRLNGQQRYTLVTCLPLTPSGLQLRTLPTKTSSINGRKTTNRNRTEYKRGNMGLKHSTGSMGLIVVQERI